MIVANITQLIIRRFELRQMISKCMEEISNELNADLSKNAKGMKVVYSGEIDNMYKIIIEDVVITFDTDQVNVRNGSRAINKENIRNILLEILSEGLGVIPITGL